MGVSSWSESEFSVEKVGIINLEVLFAKSIGLITTGVTDIVMCLGIMCKDIPAAEQSNDRGTKFSTELDCR